MSRFNNGNFWRGLFGCAFGLHRFHYNTVWDGLQEVALAHCQDCCQARAFWPEGYGLSGRQGHTSEDGQLRDEPNV